MNKEFIIKEITEDVQYKQYCDNFSNSDDLYQFVILSLLEMKEERLIAINKGNQKNYIKRMIWLNATSKTSPFFKLMGYNHELNLYDENKCTAQDDCLLSQEYEKTHEENYNKLEKFINKEVEKLESEGKEPLALKLFYLNANGKSLHKLAKESGVPYPTIRYTIKQLTKRMNEVIINHTT